MIKHICAYCGKEFVSRYKVRNHCGDRLCRNTYNREYYNNRTYDKECVICKLIFKGKRNETVCDNCKDDKGKTLYYPSYEVLRDILCKYCDNIIKTDVIKSHNNTKAKSIRTGRVCETCKSNNKKTLSEMRMGENNPNWKGGVSKIKPMSKEEFSKYMSERMKRDNPMFRKDVRDKMSKTLKEGYASGRLKRKTGEIRTYNKKFGRDHWLWKGNRERSQIIRSRLYNVWIKPIMSRDKYTCQMCGKHNTKLEVHHSEETFSDILQKFKGEKSLSDFTEIEFEEISDSVVNYHIDGVVGITLCKKCHISVDPKRF